jgi:group I intron endonuclease
MSTVSGIYKIQSKIKPERIYIGSAIDYKNRKSTHLNNLRKNKHHSIKLQNHYNEYGESDLIFKLIEPCFPQFLLCREQEYIDSLNPYFNICKTAGSSLGIKRSDEYIKKLKSRIVSDETRKLLGIKSKGNKGRKGTPLTDEHKEKIRQKQSGKNNSFYNKSHSEETKQKIRDWDLSHNRKPPCYHKGRKKGAKNKPKIEVINIK